MSTPSLDPDDPRLTAYALGEANDAERQAVEQYLAESAEGRSEIEQTQAIVRVLAAEYARENAAYLASRYDEEVPSNIVAFPSGRTRTGWRAIVPILKVAAVAALTASLIYLTLRRPHGHEIATVASAPTGESVGTERPKILATGQFSKDEGQTPQDQAGSDASQASASEKTEPQSVATTPASATGSGGDVSLAMERPVMADKSPAVAASGQVADRFSKQEAAPPPSTLDALTSAPGAASASVPTAPHPAKPSLPDDRIARSLVRIRTATGTYFGGVLVSTDGLILAVSSLPEKSLRQPCTVSFSDQSERPAIAKAEPMGSGWTWFLVDAKELPAVTLADEFPANNAPLSIALVDPLTGATTFPPLLAGDADSSRRPARAQLEKSSRPADGANFAFNAAGELLVIDHATQKPQGTTQAATRGGSSETARTFVRPFTDAERAMLQKAAKREASK